MEVPSCTNVGNIERRFRVHPTITKKNGGIDIFLEGPLKVQYVRSKPQYYSYFKFASHREMVFEEEFAKMLGNASYNFHTSAIMEGGGREGNAENCFSLATASGNKRGLGM